MRQLASIAALPILLAGFFALMQPLLAAQGSAKMPIPDADAQAKATALMLDIYADDLANAKTNEAKSRLAAELFKQGKDAKDYPAIRYVCYNRARDLAAQANDTSLALAVVDELSRIYDLDALLMKADVLGLAAAAATEKETGFALVELIRPLLNEAVDLDHYKAAHQLGGCHLHNKQTCSARSHRRGGQEGEESESGSRIAEAH